MCFILSKINLIKMSQRVISDPIDIYSEFEIFNKLYQQLDVQKSVSGTAHLLQTSVENAELISIYTADQSGPSSHTFTFATIWNQICEAAQEGREVFKEMGNSKKPQFPEITKIGPERKYLEDNIFPVLLPALEEMLIKAREWNCLEVQKCRFNGLDCLAEILWNRNPAYPGRAHSWKDVFSIPKFKKWLRKHPRPIYEKSWLWSKEEAAIVIQSAFRGYLVRREPEVQEMRHFWKVLEAEKKEEEKMKCAQKEKWHQEALEEERQRKEEQAERVRERLEIAKKENEAAMISRARKIVPIKEEIEEKEVKKEEEEDEVISQNIYNEDVETENKTFSSSSDLGSTTTHTSSLQELKDKTFMRRKKNPKEDPIRKRAGIISSSSDSFQ